MMAHPADCEIAWSRRLRQVFGEENPTLQSFDQDAWGKAYLGYSFEQARMMWEGLRAWNVASLANLTEEHKRRPAVRREYGTVTLWMIAGIAGHDLHHLHRLGLLVDSYKLTTS